MGLVCALLLPLAADGTRVHASDTLPFADAEGYFLILTDLHIGSGKGDSNTRAIVAEVTSMNLRPDFVLLTGDVTEMNQSSEWRSAVQILAPLIQQTHVYTLRGNHDARWPNDGQDVAAQTLHPGRLSLSWHGVQVLGLDSTVDLEQHGHIGMDQERWLVQQLQQARAGGAVGAVVASHHPIGWSSTFVGDQDEVLTAIDQAEAQGGVPVSLILSGHGHSFSTQLPDGRINQMIGAALDGSYAVVAREGDRLTVYGKQVGRAWDQVMSVPVQGLPRPQIRLVSPAPAQVWESTTPIPLQVQITAPAGQPFMIQDVSWRVDDGSWDSLEPSANDMWQGQIDPTRGVDGVHRLQVQVDTGLKKFVFTTSLATFARGTRLLWRVQTGGSIQAPPVVDGQTLLVANGAGQVLALDRQTGRTLRTYQAGGPVIGAPAVDDRRVMAASKDGHLYAWDKNSGQLVWSFATGAAIYATPLVDPQLDAVYVSSGDGRLYAIRRSDGSKLWSVLLGGAAEGAPLLVDDTLWVGTWAGTVHRVDRRTGKVVQRITNGRTYYTSGPCTPAADSGVVVVTNTDSKVYAYDLTDGNLLWTVAKASGYASPAVDSENHQVILSTLNGEIYALDVRNGDVVWSSTVGEGVYNSSPVLWRTPWGTTEVLVGTIGGKVWRLDAQTGRLVGPVQAGGDFLFARVRPVDGENTVYVGSMDGNVYAFALAAPAAY